MNEKAETFVSAFLEKLAATYSRRTYRTTTIGNTVFDGRVRNGNGSDHSFMATKNRKAEAGGRNPEDHDLADTAKLLKINPRFRAVTERIRPFSENYTQGHEDYNS